jgi:hypothetical protein
MVEFLPSDDPEGRLFAADIVGHLFGYAQLTNTRALARAFKRSRLASGLQFGNKCKVVSQATMEFDVGRFRIWTIQIPDESLERQRSSLCR